MHQALHLRAKRGIRDRPGAPHVDVVDLAALVTVDRNDSRQMEDEVDSGETVREGHFIAHVAHPEFDWQTLQDIQPIDRESADLVPVCNEPFDQADTHMSCRTGDGDLQGTCSRVRVSTGDAPSIRNRVTWKLSIRRGFLSTSGCMAQNGAAPRF